jgi:formimidoylglutamate deiminase
MESLFARLALLPEGWRENVRIGLAADGTIADVETGSEAVADEGVGILMPGFSNVHSHAFQRALAGRAEVAGDSDDSFWTWRDLMYRLADRLTPKDLTSISRLLYVEMLEAGYTAVGEFHYLHHDPAGELYEEPIAMSLALAHAAAEAGISLALLPVLYRYSDFGARPPEPAQRRFSTTPEQFVAMVHRLRDRLDDCIVGVAFHSLRAVDVGSMRDVIAALGQHPGFPVHIHVAEQAREVEACLQLCGQRPVEMLLLEDLPDENWCLIHATHINDAELRGIAASGAVAGLCPTTEANLGDGIFPLRSFLQCEGRFAIGSDSHVSLDPFEELRWLEYGQRLRSGKRLRAVTGNGRHAGFELVRSAAVNGAAALSLNAGQIAPGQRANLLVLDPNAALVDTVGEDNILDALVFAPRRAPVDSVMVDGRWVLRQGRHPLRDLAVAEYRACCERLRLA